VGTFGDHIFIVMELVEGSTSSPPSPRAARAPGKRREPPSSTPDAGSPPAHAVRLVHRDFQAGQCSGGKDARTGDGLRARASLGDNSAAAPTSPTSPTESQQARAT